MRRPLTDREVQPAGGWKTDGEYATGTPMFAPRSGTGQDRRMVFDVRGVSGSRSRRTPARLPFGRRPIIITYGAAFVGAL